MAKKGKFAVGAILGAVVGVFAGILTAPKSGKDTREQLRTKAQKAKVDVTKKAKVVADKAGEVAEGVKAEAVDLKKRAENAVEGAKQGFKKK
ncbi:YtxH domain-containing protein [Candidatus Saccharibacteria bacterium]|nr:YtxH domain-containing protein [Candidatus Saccharibacteria bacterium]